MKRSCCVLLCLLILGIVSLPIYRAAGVPETNTPPGEPLTPPVQPLAGSQTVPPAPAIPAKVVQVADFLAWDAGQKEYVATFGEAEAHFKFSLTNISKEVVTVYKVATSCGCTTAHLPPMPWALAPGTNGDINVTMNLAGKMGIVYKTVTVSTDKGNKVLMVKVTIMPGAADASMGARLQNQKMAQGDRQAVFRGDCARCHVQPGVGKSGKELYLADCAICHEAEHRATMVPDLHNLPHETSHELWEIWIDSGKPGSLMPAFSASEGGPLSQEQIRSLADYLTATIPSKPAQPATPPAVQK